MNLDHINTIGLATTIIAAPIFTGIYALGNALHTYASIAIVNKITLDNVANIFTHATADITVDNAAKLIPSAANAVALRASNSLVVVKQAIEPVCEAVCEAVKPAPLMIAPPPAFVPPINPIAETVSPILFNNSTINIANKTADSLSVATNTSVSSGYSSTNISRFVVDGYRIGKNIKNGEYLRASAYGLGMAIDYALNDTLSSTVGMYAESITGSSNAGLLVKGIFSISTSIALRKVVPFFADGIYNYFYPITDLKEIQARVIIAKTEATAVVKTGVDIETHDKQNQKTPAMTKVTENNVNINTNKTAEIKAQATSRNKTTSTPRVRRETSDERQFKRKLAELGVVEQETPKEKTEETKVASTLPKKKPVVKQRKTTSKERQFERKLAALMMSPEDNQEQQEQDENKYVEPNYDAFLNRKNDYNFVRHCDKKETTATSSRTDKAAIADITNITVPTTVSIPTPAQRRDARLAKKAAAEKASLVQTVAIDGSARELAKKSFKDKNCHPDLTIEVTNTGNVKTLSKTLSVENHETAPLLDGAKFVFDALKNLLTIIPQDKDEAIPVKALITPAKNLDWARKESGEFWNQAAHRSYARMKKAEEYVNRLKDKTIEDNKYTDESMIERAQSLFEDHRKAFEKDSVYLTSLPKAANF